MQVNLPSTWKKKLANELEESYFRQLIVFLASEYETHTIYPPSSQIFSAFEHCSYEELKVVIIGQDPYHGPSQANGLCFSVGEEEKLPPSLRNIFKEIETDVGKPIPTSGNLVRWAEQGILLLNATLTVRANEPGSHQNKGWENFTDTVIRYISENTEHIVFLLWGAYAQQKGEVIDDTKHLVLKSSHPSPFAAYRGFFGNKHFSKTNYYLRKIG
ncbi:MAG: uracil-DNA glycosylase, partial [Cyclobacteriaceae bacterium]|nr:uracil-DNA glycosylase [Cyclobacteriaceae bacterium]